MGPCPKQTATTQETCWDPHALRNARRGQGPPRQRLPARDNTAELVTAASTTHDLSIHMWDLFRPHIPVYSTKVCVRRTLPQLSIAARNFCGSFFYFLFKNPPGFPSKFRNTKVSSVVCVNSLCRFCYSKSPIDKINHFFQSKSLEFEKSQAPNCETTENQSFQENLEI